MAGVENVSDQAALATRVLQLTRWHEHLLFTLPATLLGVSLALERSGAVPESRVGAVILGNVLAVAFAFMVNDIEDAPDDQHDAARRSRNVVAAGRLTPTLAWRAATVVAVLSAVSFAAVNWQALVVGSGTLLLGWLYSWRRVRLKALPVLDVVSHVLMLSALLFFAGFVTYADALRVPWPVMVGVAFISAYGQFYNQLRDYEDDRRAGLHNTAHVLGRRGTRWMMYAALIAAVLSFAAALANGLIPVWFVLLMLSLSPLVLAFRTTQDMRGTPAMDASGGLQTGVMALATAGTAIWLLVHVAG